MSATDKAADVIPQFRMDELEAPPLSLRQLTWRRFRRHRLAMFGAVVLVLLFVFSFGGALFYTEDYANYTDTAIRLQPPSRPPRV